MGAKILKARIWCSRASWVHREVRRGIHGHDRVILVCSENSLTRAGVLHEIETILALEAKMGGTARLIPIILDDFFYKDWAPEDRPDLKDELEMRVVADFRGTDTDDAKFREALGRLLKALKKPT